MSGLSAFLNMGGYARFVWPAYGLSLLVLMANVVIPMWRERALRRRLRRRYEREQV
ncbi:MAG: heme exporter protein CcmD [Gammaproteobacteria bacterium]